VEFLQNHIIKFLYLKGVTYGNIRSGLSNRYGQDAQAKLSIKYWPYQLKLGEKTSPHNAQAEDRLSTISTLKSYRFFGDLRLPRCEPLLTPGAFLRPRYLRTWLKRLG
jgi:hypothetical protein